MKGPLLRGIVSFAVLFLSLSGLSSQTRIPVCLDEAQRTSESISPKKQIPGIRHSSLILSPYEKDEENKERMKKEKEKLIAITTTIERRMKGNYQRRERTGEKKRRL